MNYQTKNKLQFLSTLNDTQSDALETIIKDEKLKTRKETLENLPLVNLQAITRSNTAKWISKQVFALDLKFIARSFFYIVLSFLLYGILVAIGWQIMYLLNPNIEFSQFQLFTIFFLGILEATISLIAFFPIVALIFLLVEYAFSSN